MSGGSEIVWCSNLLFDGSKWSREENKRFEDALALFDKETPDRWQNVARLIPGKTESDVMSQYQKLVEDISEIEAGVLHFYTRGPGPGGKNIRLPDHEKKKGIPWTEEEHRQFLLGLKKYGKGDWRNISRNFVTSRTPTQVASHAQKYFIRQLSGGKDKRRSSIHDITTVHLNEAIAKKKTPGPGDQCTPPSHYMAKALYQFSVPNQQLLPTNNSSLQIQGSSSYGPQYGHLGTVFQGNC